MQLQVRETDSERNGRAKYAAPLYKDTRSAVGASRRTRAKAKHALVDPDPGGRAPVAPVAPVARGKHRCYPDRGNGPE